MFREVFEERVVQKNNIMLNFIDRHNYRNLGFKGEKQAPVTLNQPGVYILSDGKEVYVGQSTNIAERFSGHEKKLRYAIVLQASYNIVGFTSGMIDYIEALLIQILIEQPEIDLLNKVIEIDLDNNFEQSMGIDVLKAFKKTLKTLQKSNQDLFQLYQETFLVLELLTKVNYTQYQTNDTKVHNVLDDYILRNYVFNQQDLVLKTERQFLNAAQHLVKDVNYHLMEVEFAKHNEQEFTRTPYLIFIDATKPAKVAYEALALTLMHGSDVKVINIMKNNKAPYVTDMSYYDDGADCFVEVLNYDLSNDCFLNKSEAKNKIDYVVTKHKDPYETCVYDFAYNNQNIYINSSGRI